GEGDRHIHPQVRAVALEHRMRSHGYGQHEVARLAPVGTRLALTAQLDLLTVLDASRDLDLGRLATRQLQGDRVAVDRREEVERRRRGDVGAGCRPSEATVAAARAAEAAGAEHAA